MSNFIFITLLAAFPALSTDMYLPALPIIQEQMGIPLATVNLSLVLFFVFFSFSLLIYGPLSDRIGRRPVLLGGITVYILGSVLCALSNNIWLLVAARIVQAAGAASASALSMALAKDVYTGVERQKVLAYIGVIIPLCPMIAPLFGSLVLEYASWHWIFACQAALASLAMYGTIVFDEPEFEKIRGPIWSVVRRYGVVLSNVPFSLSCFTFSFMGIGFFGFLAGSPDIYVQSFGLTEQQYAMFFGFNALGFMLGSFLCSRLCVDMTAMDILRGSLIGILISSIAVYFFSGTAIGFAITMFCMTFSIGVSRPVSNHMILETVDSDVGTASSILTFTYFILGAVAMQFISFDWTSKPQVISQMGVAAGIIPLAALLFMRKRQKKA
ncbi:Bcr/CflA family efflux MFS transporter [Halodesulfovibrio marinisediminis]|uniref:MFS transporter, DHA1 family, bicyclomycin/chloramphenicol resistance protein n=1 Tax=Halodesulfovibrio marinisediminis DSM 17456 TaxID=1121457 RepID=A0A1N6I770_9BACT|nr:Bcr/CflA family efflux MFS transporter [Halodesulfovibrio marinisediminis]SIO27864.1 MFS transporter, DHA1 family, bicyclomycin/chloramphenicol resistance protein [Halodesulfovibrio marinisediminis DSM 17456]